MKWVEVDKCGLTHEKNRPLLGMMTLAYSVDIITIGMPLEYVKSNGLNQDEVSYCDSNRKPRTLKHLHRHCKSFSRKRLHKDLASS